MQYLVNVSGEVLEKQNKTYAINSKTYEDAEIIARKRFNNEFTAECDTVYIVADKTKTLRILLAIFLMLGAVFLSIIPWKDGHETISICPDMLSTIIGVGVYVIFAWKSEIFQRIPQESTLNLIKNLFFIILSGLILASFVRTIFETKTINILGITSINIDTTLFFVAAIILSMLGMKLISVICIGIIIIAGLSNICSLNIAMGNLWGTIYAICVMFGSGLYISTEPTVLESKSLFKEITTKSIRYLGNDISIAKEKVFTTKNKLINHSNEE